MAQPKPSGPGAHPIKGHYESHHNDTMGNVTVTDDMLFQVAEPWINDLFYHLNWMCPVSCLVMVYGFFSNLLAIGVLKHNYFHYMKLPIYLVILSMLNLCMNLVLTLQIFSCLIDAATDSHGMNDPSLYPVCVFIAWAENLLRYTTSAMLVFIVHNRLKAQGARDSTKSRLKAKRVPIIVTMTIMVLSIVPSSIYSTLKMDELKNISSFRCTHLYYFPVMDESAADRVVYLFPMVCEILVTIILIAVFIRNWANSRHRTLQAKYSVHESHSGNFGRFNVKQAELKERDKSMTRCVVILCVGYLPISFIRHAVKDIHEDHEDNVPVTLLMDMIYMVYISSTFAIFFLGNEQFREVVADYYNETFLENEFYTDIDLANRVDVFRHSSQAVYVRPSGPVEWDFESSEATADHLSRFVLEDFKATRDQLRLNHIAPTPGARRRDWSLSRQRSRHSRKPIVVKRTSWRKTSNARSQFSGYQSFQKVMGVKFNPKTDSSVEK